MPKYLPGDDQLIVRLNPASMQRLRNRRADNLELEAVVGEVLAVGFTRWVSSENDGRLKFCPGDAVWCQFYSIHVIADAEAIVSVSTNSIVCKAER